MKFEYSDGLSTNSEFSSDSQNSQMSGTDLSNSDFLSATGNGIQPFTPTTVS